LYLKQKKWELATERLKTAIDINPDLAEAHGDLGTIYQAQGVRDRAVFHYRCALRLDPARLTMANRLAWLLSTSADSALRDGQEAVRWALRCAEATQYDEPGVLDTLAAAHAEAGDFRQAASWEAKALELAPEPMKPGCRQRLELYQAGQPYREPGATRVLGGQSD
jgi:Tfp pilus assembly protein PilF